MTLTDTPRRPESDGRRAGLKQTLWSGLLAGVGVVAFIDETVFHQLLHWHHFYDRSTSAAGLVSDGIFHVAGFTAMVVGLIRYDVTIWPYDLTWNGIAVIMLAAGVLLMLGRANVARTGIFRTRPGPADLTSWPCFFP
jgi:uncharacterized membrane protein